MIENEANAMSDPDRERDAGEEAQPQPANEAESGSESAATVDETGSLKASLEAAQAEAAKYKDQMLRALAEIENTRRRAQRDSEDSRKYATQNFARDLLPVADNLRRAIASLPPELLAADEALRNLAAGVELTERLLLSAFERHNLRKIEPLGERFDSNLH